MQLPLLNLRALRDAMKKRGFSDLGLFARDPWETLDREGVLVPAAYSRHGFWNHDVVGSLENGDLKIREEAGYVAWGDLRAEAADVYGDEANPQVLYNHWQILSAAEIQTALTPQMPWGKLGDSLEAFYEMRARISAAPDGPPRERLIGLAQALRARELLLIRVQNMLWPGQRGDPGRSRWISGPVIGLTEDAADWADEQLHDTDFAALAADCGTDPDGLAALYDRLGRQALRLDPNARILDLLDQIRRGRREGLEGSARLAFDYYDAARILRVWHHLASGEAEWLPDVDELRGSNGTEFKRSRFGTLNVRGNLAVLPTLLEDYGLYPWRVQLIGEGESELVALREVIQAGYGLTFERLGIAVTDMGGADIPANAERLLGDLRTYANYFLLVFDNEGRARELIDALQQAGVVEGIGDDQRRRFLSQLVQVAKQLDDPDARTAALTDARERAANMHQQPGEAPEFVLWKQNFEADNFTAEELCDVINSSVGGRATIDVATLTAAMAERPLAGIATVAVDLMESLGGRLGKPDLARALARYALDHPQHDDERRPLLVLAEHLLQLSDADRRLSGRLRG